MNGQLSKTVATKLPFTLTIETSWRRLLEGNQEVKVGLASKGKYYKDLMMIRSLDVRISSAKCK